MMRLKAGEAHGFAFDKPKRVEVGKTYGHLEVLEELPQRRGAGERQFRCRCVNIVDGKECGNVTIKRTGDLTKGTKFRACKACLDVFMRETRNRWNRGGSY